ncbi:MAG: glycosyltransferase family 4 protein [bacterium]|nr:glycosyltransferase family 4 protein [bacterium]
MKILHVIYDDIDNPWVGGGGALRALEINRHLSSDHEITMLTGKFPNSKTGKTDNIEFIRTGTDKSYLLSRLFFTLFVPFRIRKIEFDLLVNEFSVFSPCFCHWYTSKTVIHTFYHIIGAGAIRKFFVLGIFAWFFEKIFLRSADNIITISPSVTERISKNRADKSIRCIYTGIDKDLFNTVPEDSDYIAFLGRIDLYMKGLDTLIEAFSKISGKGLKLRIAGSGPQKNIDKLKSLIHDHSLENEVQLEGRISDEEKKELLRKARFLVMPSRFEGWGIAAIEASACAKPVIGTKIPGLEDAVLDGKTGILVEPDDAEQLSGAIVKLWNDPELCGSLGKEGREWAKNFDWETISEKQLEYYHEIIGKN